MDKTTERIKADAAKYCKDEALGSREDCSYCIQDYIAGATAVHERAQKMVDALKYIQKFYDTKDISLSMYAAGVIKEYEQYNAAAPARPCPHCGKELDRDRNLCCGGKEVEG